LILASVNFAYCSYAYSFPYKVFNTTTISYYQLDKNYTTFEAKFLCQLTIASGKKALIKITDAKEGVVRSIDLAFFDSGIVDVNYDDGISGGVKITSLNWNTTIVIQYDGKKLYVGDGKSVLATLLISGFTARYLAVTGEIEACSNGFLNVEVNDYYSVTNIFESLMPAIILALSLGLIFGALTKVMRKVKL